MTVLFNRRKYMRRRGSPQGASPDIGDAVVTLSSETVTYTGSPVYPSVTVTYEGATLVANTDYLLAYNDNTNVGAATVVVTGIGDFTGSVVKTFQIVSSSAPSDEWVFDISKMLSAANQTDVAAVDIEMGETDAELFVLDDSGKVQKLLIPTGGDISGATVVAGASSAATGAQCFTFGDNGRIVVFSKWMEVSPRVENTYFWSIPLSTPYDVSEVDFALDVADADVELGGRLFVSCFSKDGLYLYILKTSIRIDVYALSQPFDISSASFVEFVQRGQLVADSNQYMTGFRISPGGGRALASQANSAIYASTLATPLVLSTAVKDGSASTFAWGGDFAVNHSITKLYMVKGMSPYYLIQEYDLTIQGMDNWTISLSSDSVEYTGSAIMPTVTATKGSTTLTENVDYRLQYYDNVNPGTATILIIGIGRNMGSIVKTFEITSDRSLEDNVAEITVESPITASERSDVSVEPPVTVTYDGASLVRNKDYTLVYSDNTNPGTGTVVVTGKGAYSGSVTKTFTINALDISQAQIRVESPMQPTGSAVYPSVRIYSANGYDMNEGIHYTLAYHDNVQPGVGSVVITGIGKYAGSSVTKTFKITINVLDHPELLEITGFPNTDSDNRVWITPDANAAFTEWSHWSWAWSKTIALCPLFGATLKYNGTTLVYGEDFVVKVGGYDRSAAYTEHVLGLTYERASLIAHVARRNNNASVVYSGSGLLDTNNSDATDYPHNANPLSVIELSGSKSIRVFINFIDGYSGSVDLGTVFVNGMKGFDYSLTLPGGTQYAYTGSAITPSVTVTDSDTGTTLTENTDYTVSYSNNVNVGVGKITITPKQNSIYKFCDTKEVGFNIVAS